MKKTSNVKKAVFFDRDGVINKHVGLLYKINDFELCTGAAKAIKTINDAGILVIVATNQPVIARNLCTILYLRKIHKKMKDLLLKEGAKIDAIYFCPHHPDKGYPEERKQYKIKCKCRKPDIGMIKQAQKDFNINLKKSYIIGDNWRDILCGKKAGITSIGIKEGDYCFKNEIVKPDYHYKNISEAVKFIVNESRKK